MGCFSSKVKVQGEKPKEPTYKGKFVFFGPSVSGDVYSTDCDHLYRVCVGNTWYFYNDTTQREFRIQVDFGPRTDVVPATAKSLPDRSSVVHQSGKYPDGTRCTVVVYPFETVPFVRFKGEEGIDCFDASFTSLPITRKFVDHKVKAANQSLRKNREAITALLKANPSVSLDEVLEECISENMPFVDYTFSPAPRSIERPDKDSHNINDTDGIQWMRPVDIVPAELSNKVQLYRRGIKPKWVVQGSIGDCWLISAITIVSMQPALTRQLFKHPISASLKKKERKVGAYRVWLNLGGWWTNIIVDNYLPTEDLELFFASSCSDPFSLWVPLIEKAYAKAYGSYSAIVGGLTGDGIRDLSGFPYFDVEREVCVAASKDEDDAEYFFDDLRSWLRRKFVVSIGTPGEDASAYVVVNHTDSGADTSFDDADDEEAEEENEENSQENESDSECASVGDYDFDGEVYETDSEDSTASSDDNQTWTRPSEAAYEKMGLVMGHAYCILDICQLPGSSKRLVKVRNPHGGDSTWKGKWGNTSDVWKRHPFLRVACKPNAKDNDGTFWMDWRDVVKWFDPCSFSVNMLKPKWRDYRVKGAFRQHRPSVVLRVDVETEKDIPFYFTISFKSSRGTGQDSDTMCKLLLSWDDYPDEDAEMTYLDVGHRRIPIGRAKKPFTTQASNGKDEEDDEPTRQFLVAASSRNGDVPYDLLDEEDVEKVRNIYSDQVTMSYQLSSPMSPYYIIPILSPQSEDVPYVLSIFCPQKASSSTYDVSFVQFNRNHPVFSGAMSFDYIRNDPENDKLVACDLQTCRPGRAPMTARGTSLLEWEEIPYGEK